MASLLAVILSATLARLLSPEEMGGYFLAFNLACFFSIFCRFGAESTVLRFVSESLEREEFERVRQIVIKTLLLLFMTGGVTGTIFYAGLGKWLIEHVLHSENLLPVSGLIPIWLVLISLQIVLVEVFRAFHDIRYATLFGGLFTSLVTVLLLACYWLIFRQASLAAIIELMLIAYVVNSICGMLLLRKWLRPTSAYDPGNVEYFELLHHSWPIFFSVLTMFIVTGADLWILSAFRSAEELGLYGAAVRLVGFTAMPLALVNNVVSPLIIRLNIRDEKTKMERLLRATAGVAALPALLILGLFTGIGNYLLQWIFGAYYAVAHPILVVLTVGQVVNVLTGSSDVTLIMTGHRSDVMLCSFVAAIIGPGLALYFVGPYGPMGVACSFTAATIVYQLLMLMFVRYRCKLWTHARMSFVKELKQLFSTAMS